MRTKNGYLVDELGRYVHRYKSMIQEGPIPRDWEVHHCDGDKQNNFIENLVQLPKELHREIHDRFHIERPSKWEIQKRLIPEYYARKLRAKAS